MRTPPTVTPLVPPTSDGVEREIEFGLGSFHAVHVAA